MTGRKRSVKNTAKNILLLALVGLMLMLCAINWLLGMNVAQMPADHLLRRAHDHQIGRAHV